MSVRKKYRNNPESFSFEYKRENATRKISMDIEDNIMKELVIEKQPIAYPKIPIRLYNYSYVRDRLLSIYGKKVSAPTIISIKWNSRRY